MKIDLYKNGSSERFMRILVLALGCLSLFMANLWPAKAQAGKAEATESVTREKLHETQQQIRSRGVQARGDLKFYADKVSLRAIDLSQDVRTEDLVKAGQLGSPLTPSISKSNDAPGAESGQADNRQFAEAIQKWNQHHYDEAVKLFAAHIKAHPKSPWLGESQLHLGCEAQFSGRWNEAETHFNDILSTNAPGSDIYQKAKLRHAILMVEKGQFPLARAEFTELLAAESSWERKTYAQHWLLQVDRYEAHATQLRVCGRDAVVKVLELSGKKESAQKARLESAQHDQGFSIAELLEFAHKYGLNGTAVRAGANVLTKLPFPFIAHYSDNHYVAVLAAAGNGKVRLYDPRLQRETVISRESFLSQWSGVAVIFGPPPSGVKMVSNTEAQDVVGGCCGIPRYPSGLGGTGTTGCGMPAWSVNPVNMNLVVSDTPLWYSNQFGPSVAITITYNSQDSLNQVRPFGNKWVFNYASYAMESPGGAPQGSVLIVMPDGRGDIYQPDGNGGYNSPSGVISKLVKTGAYAFQLTNADGSVYAYGVPPSMSGNGFASLLLSITDRYGNALTIQHDGAGNITQIVDPLGRTTQFSYNQAGLVEMVQDPFGRKATFSYDSNRNLTGQSDMGGLEYGYSYDATVYLASIIKPTGTTTFYIEPADGINNGSNPYPAPGGTMFQNYRITVTDPEGNKEEYYYAGFQGYGWYRDRIQMKSPLAATQGPKTRFDFTMASGQGVVGWITYEDGSVIQYSNFDLNRLPQTVVNENGGTETFTYNQSGRPLSYTNALQHTFEWTYAQNGIDVATVTDPLSETTTVSYDALRNPISIQNALNQTTTLSYNNRGQLTAVIKPGGEETDFAYDSLGELTTVRRAGQVLRSFTYDAIGRIATATDAAGDFVACQYDNLNRTVAIKYPDGTSQTWNWACCRVDSYIARDQSTSEYYYDDLNRMVGFRNPDKGYTFLTYDENGNLTQLIDPDFHVTQYVYGPRNRLLAKQFADGTNLQYQYDASGKVTSIVDNAGRKTSFSYDQNENLTTEVFPDLPTVTFAYDALDRVSTMTDGTGPTQYKYDAAGRPASISNSQNNSVVTFAWDGNGRLTERDINSVAQKYVYDAIGRVTSVTNALGTFAYGYPDNVSPLVNSVILPNGIQSSNTYDESAGDVRLKSIGYTDGSGNNILNFGFSYTTNAQVQALVSQLGSNPSTTTTYGYDPAGQLTSALTQTTSTGQNIRSYSFVYDAAGNRIGQTIDATVASYQYNELNQLTAQTGGGVIPFRGTVSKPASVTVNGQPARMTANIAFESDLSVQSGQNPIHVEAVDGNGTKTANDYTLTVTGVGNKNYQYDLNGNLVSDGDNTYTWDSQNRVTGIQGTRTGGTQLQFTYDGLGRNVRIVQLSGGSVVADHRFIWVGLERCEERDASGNVVKRFFSQGEVVGGTPRYFLKDHLGSIRAVAESDASISMQYDYSPWGEQSVISGNNPADFGFTGHYTGVGPTLAPYRLYNAQLGRFISRDPLGEKGGLNLYGYVGNDPVNAVDPFGLCAESDDPGTSAMNLLGAWWEGIESGVGALQLGMLTLESPETPLASRILSDALEGGATGAVEEAVAAESAGATESGLTVAAPGGGDVLPASVLRTIGKGESIADLIVEAKTITYTTTKEVAVVSLENGQRVLVQGGTGGIDLSGLSVRRILGHTQPTTPFSAGPVVPSSRDIEALQHLHQTHSYIFERGQLIRFGNE